MKIKIITDASSDISKEIAKKYDITVLPLAVRFGDEEYPVGLETKQFYEKLKSFNGLPKTSQINQFTYEEVLKPYANKEDVFVIIMPISSELSGTYVQAQMAVNSLEAKNMYVLDTQNVTFALGALVIETAKLIEKGLSSDEVISGMLKLREKVKLVAIIGDLKYLKLGGRLSSASAFLGSMLNIKPIITLSEGKVIPIAKAMGMIKANNFLVQKASIRDESLPLYFGHTNCEEALKSFMEKYKDELKIQGNENITFIGSVVGTHAGPGAYGIVYFE